MQLSPDQQSIVRNRIIVVGEENHAAIRGFKWAIESKFPDRFYFDDIPYLRPTEDTPTSPSKLLMKMHRQHPASLVILFDDFSPQDSHEIMKPSFLGTINKDIPGEADRLMQTLPPAPIIIVETDDIARKSLLEGKFADAQEKNRAETREEVIRLLREKKEAAMNLLLDSTPCSEGARLAQEMHRTGSPLEDVPLLVIGVYPTRKDEFIALGGKNTLVFSSSDNLDPGITHCYAKAQEFILKNVVARQK